MRRSWNKEIQKLEKYFESIELPDSPFVLTDWITIVDCEHFVKTHLFVAKAKNGSEIYYPAVERLKMFAVACERML